MNLWWQSVISVIVVSIITGIVKGFAGIKSTKILSKEGMIGLLETMGDFLIAYYLFSAFVGHRLF